MLVSGEELHNTPLLGSKREENVKPAFASHGCLQEARHELRSEVLWLNRSVGERRFFGGDSSLLLGLSAMRLPEAHRDDSEEHMHLRELCVRWHISRCW